MSFADDIKKFAEKTGNNMEDTVVTTIFQLNELVVKRTPVDTGRARGGWVASVGNPSSSKGSQDTSGSATISKANRKAAGSVGNIYYLANNVEYIMLLEYGRSGQAPQGMARISAQEIKQNMRNYVSK